MHEQNKFTHDDDEKLNSSVKLIMKAEEENKKGQCQLLSASYLCFRLINFKLVQ
jgi:hypothetical protein